ncbi:MAG: excinuclease ABC subunit UvrC [Spirochaetes bacterium]|nr:excinuclease ABC subunit UvrC [Spirochaetota bacterium]
MDISRKIKDLPNQAGVYLMKEASGKIIYIGKAKDLKKRVSSYFSGKLQDIKTRILTDKITDFDLILTENEIEALILEDNLIKKHLPRYNISLKDDKRYPYLKITLHTEDYPMLIITRERKNDQDLYLGPYPNARFLKEIIRMLIRLYPVKKCSKKLLLKRYKDLYLKPVGKYCLYFQLKQCMGPCQGKVDPTEYSAMIDQIILFLEGKDKEFTRELKSQMDILSQTLQFEKAQVIRDRLIAFEKIMEKQKIVSNNFESRDIYAITEKENVFNITILFIRQGKLIGKDNFILHNKINTAKKVLNDFIKQFYIDSNITPEMVLIPFPIEDKYILQRALKNKNKIVSIRSPKQEIEKNLYKMAKENADAGLNNYFADTEYKSRKRELTILKKELHLKRDPESIEGFDISNIQGKFAVGSMVRFTEGIPDKKEYRKFKIRTIEGIDDVKMIREIVFRRYKRILEEKKALPDLILIDGGKGQLHFAQRALQELGLENLPAVSLAKKEELIFRSHTDEPIRLPGSNPGLRLLQRIRDEAHRFAIQYHKLLRSKNLVIKKK